MKLFLLSKENIGMAKAEVESIAGKGTSDGNFFLTRSSATQLGYTRKVFDVLFGCTKKELLKKMETYPWDKVYKKNFSLRIHGKLAYTEKALAGYVWRKVKRPKVNLENAATQIELLVGKKIYACLLEQSIEEDFHARKAHNRPALHPSSMDPKLARVMINLTGIKKGLITDPFCGSGGLLIEAGLMGLFPVGFDIDRKMLDRAKTNLNHYGIKKYSLHLKDALELAKVDYVVTDLPYGRNTKLNKDLYKKFIQRLSKNLRKKAVIGLPVLGKERYLPLFKKYGLKIIHSFDIYIHKSLSKKIFVLST
ncbi:methyltransferase domain-containing protein [Candidatus Woesearchaeota archaeon]|nr:methyltransferase domain-containing protein [Candidatus Woesearchaeota archaeon]